MPGPACSTSMSEEQAAERNDQTRVKVSTGQKPSFMTELESGSGIYFKAFVTSENDDEVKLRFPACKETKNKEVCQWVSRCSSRIWRGPLAKDAWTKVANGEGAWRPKKRQRTAGRPGKKKGPRLDSGVRRTSTSDLAEARQDCLEGSAECPDRYDGNMATSQETVVRHDLPADPLAAWYYKNDEGSSGADAAGLLLNPSANAGCEADRPAGKPRQTGKAHHAGSALERDDSAMEETLSHSMQSKSVSRPAAKRPEVRLHSSPVISSAIPARAVRA